MTTTRIIDSYALMVFFQNASGADTIREMLLSAEEEKLNLVMCIVNLGEVWYSIARKQSEAIADEYIRAIHGMAIEIVEPDWQLTRLAASYKIRGNISYADCFAAALAKLRKGEVVTGDKEFEVLEDQVKIVWLK